MANTFDISKLAGQIKSGKDRAIALAGNFDSNRLAGHVLPPIPFPYIGGGSAVLGANGVYDEVESVEDETIDEIKYTIFGTPMCFPLSIKLSNSSDDWWLLPVEPIITIGGTNVIDNHSVAKSKVLGSLKQSWATDDYAISIEGLFTKLDSWIYPADDVRRLRRMLQARDTIEVLSPLFELFKISRIVIDKFDFPFTKGEENQAYRIAACSDEDWDLTVKGYSNRYDRNLTR